MEPLKDIHLNIELPPGNVPVRDPKYIVILTAIAGLILLIACINFIMLSLGRSFMLEGMISPPVILNTFNHQGLSAMRTNPENTLRNE
jgi:hypothetical protein